MLASRKFGGGDLPCFCNRSPYPRQMTVERERGHEPCYTNTLDSAPGAALKQRRLANREMTRASIPSFVERFRSPGGARGIHATWINVCSGVGARCCGVARSFKQRTIALSSARRMQAIPQRLYTLLLHFHCVYG